VAPDSYVATPSSPYGIFGAHFSSWRKQLGSRGLSADCPVTAIAKSTTKRQSRFENDPGRPAFKLRKKALYNEFTKIKKIKTFIRLVQ